MGEIIREPIDKMMCPNASNFPIAEAHMLRNRIIDAFSAATSEHEDEDGNLPAPLDKAYLGVAYGPVSTEMDLFVHSVGVRRHGHYVTVESWWWKCPTCGFILPAVRMPEAGRG